MTATPFRLITFDLDDTLWPCMPVILAAEEALFQWLRRRLPGIEGHHDIHSLRERRRALMLRHPEIAHDLTLVRRRSLQELFRTFGGDSDEVEEGMALFLEWRQRVQPYPEVRPVLARLRRRYSLISVTNGNADLRRIGLGDLFDHCLTAAEVGAARPHPALFAAALARAGVEAGQALHVGDDPERDVVAARQVGMEAVWLDRSGRQWPDALGPAPVQLRDLEALAAWLDGEAPLGAV